MTPQDAPQSRQEPRPCVLGKLRLLGIATDYAALHELLRRRQAELGMSFAVMNDISGLSYCDKLLAPQPLAGEGKAGKRRSTRGIGPTAWGPLLGALAAVLIVAEDPDAAAAITRRAKYQRRDNLRVRARIASMEVLVDERARALVEELIRRRYSEIGCRANQARQAKMTPEARRAAASHAARARHWR